MPLPPFATCLVTAARSFALLRSGPPLPPVPSRPWQPVQLSEKTCLPAVVSPLLVLGCCPPGSWLCPAWPPPAPPPPACSTGPSLPSREKSQRLSPCLVAASAFPPE